MNPTALDILRKHTQYQGLDCKQEIYILSAMREIYELGWKDCGRFAMRRDSHLETRLKELFGEIVRF